MGLLERLQLVLLDEHKVVLGRFLAWVACGFIFIFVINNAFRSGFFIKPSAVKPIIARLRDMWVYFYFCYQ
jgi:hypothetical protein